MHRADKVKLLMLDVDGTLTDGKIYLDQEGNETKAFHVQDGVAMKMLQAAGVRIAVVTGRRSRTVEKRARELGIADLYQGVEDKFAVLAELLKKYGLEISEVAFVGDDIPDLPVLRQVGLSFATANARAIVKDFVHVVTRAGGGEGAVAEVCERILRDQGRWDALIEPYL